MHRFPNHQIGHGVARRLCSAVLILAGAGCRDVTQEPGLKPMAAVTAFTSHYASPTGSPTGDGSITNPWNLATALAGAGGRVQSGDTVWLRGGTYLGQYTSTVSGAAGAPIVFRQYPGERATIDVAAMNTDILRVDGNWTVFWGFEIMNSSTDRKSYRGSGVWLRYGTNTKLVNLIIHDVNSGVYADPATPAEICGLIVFNGGFQDSAGGAWGHGLYLKQDAAGSKLVRDNVMFNQYGLGIQVYTNAGQGQLQNITIQGNAAFNNGALSSTASSSNILVGGEEPVVNTTVRENMTYVSPAIVGTRTLRGFRIGFETWPNADVIVTDNFAEGGNPLFEIAYWQTATISRNTLYGTSPDLMVKFVEPDISGYSWSENQYYRNPSAQVWKYVDAWYDFPHWKTASGLGASDQVTATLPSAPRVFLRPNPYEHGRAHIVVYNFTGGATDIAVDVSAVLDLGDVYELRTVQRLDSVLVTGTYSGGSITVPMRAIAPTRPIGTTPGSPVPTGPAFDVFLLTRSGTF